MAAGILAQAVAGCASSTSSIATSSSISSSWTWWLWRLVASPSPAAFKTWDNSECAAAAGPPSSGASSLDLEQSYWFSLAASSALTTGAHRWMSDFILTCLQRLSVPAAIGGIVFVTALYLIHGIALSYGVYRLHKRSKNVDVSRLPGVTIIKPLVGWDDNLFFNLESFFKLNYPKFELMFCLHDPSDPAVRIVEGLIKKYPNVATSVFYGGEDVGLNPKINNMQPGYRAARHPLVLISDSGIYMKPDALMDMVEAMDEGVALVTQTPFCMDRAGFGGTLEQVYFGTSHARIYLAGNCMRFVCSTGMSSLIRKRALDDCGGLKAFGHVLAEDYFFGVELAKRKWRAVISSMPAMQNSAGVTPARFEQRVCRWMKLRIAMLPHTIVLEPLQDCFMSGLYMAWSLSTLFGVNPYVYYAAHFSLWCLSDFVLLHIVHETPLPYSNFDFLKAWLYRESSAFPTYMKALLNPNIEWRRGTYRLKWGGQIVKVREDSVASPAVNGSIPSRKKKLH